MVFQDAAVYLFLAYSTCTSRTGVHAKYCARMFLNILGGYGDRDLIKKIT